jgi:hypothetical protein
MSFVRDFDAEQPERPQGAEQLIPRKSERRLRNAIARGSLACPSCDVPIVSGGPIPLTARVRCPFCRTLHSARAFVRLETPDTTLNEVLVTARIGR